MLNPDHMPEADSCPQPGHEPSPVPPPYPAPHSFPPETLLHLQKGFSRILWGMPLGVLLFAGVIQVRWPPFMRLPPYVMAVVLIGWGLAALFAASLPRRAWRNALRLCAGLVFLLFYFAPFLQWWTAQPYSTYLTLNVLGLLTTAAIVLYAVNMLVSEAAAAFGLRTMQIEARLCAFSSLAVVLLPLWGWIGYAGYHAWRYNWPLTGVLEGLYQLPLFHWATLLPLIPLAFTLTMCGKMSLVAEKQLNNGKQSTS